MQPRQPTYHIAPLLSIVRTKMGLTFSGPFKVERFVKWKLSRRQAKKMKNILYPSEAALNRNGISLLSTKLKIAQSLKFDFSLFRLKFNEYYRKLQTVGF